MVRAHCVEPNWSWIGFAFERGAQEARWTRRPPHGAGWPGMIEA
jgi:hypothetical protein